MPRKPHTLHDGTVNLRGRTMLLEIEGHLQPVTVVTHLRGNLWQVAGPRLPAYHQRRDGTRRCTVERCELVEQH